MQKVVISAVVISALLLSGGVDRAYAAELTFAKLQSMCRKKTDPLQQGYCTGFVEAIALRIARGDKHCAFLQEHLDQVNADLALPDLIADINPVGYPKRAFEAVEKFFYNRGCS